MRLLLLLLLLPLLLMTFSGCTYTTTGQSRVAFLDFENATGSEDYDFLKTALPEYLITQLSNSGKATMLERQDPRIVRDPNMIEKHLTSKEWMTRNLRKANYFIAGSVSRLERNFIITARLCNARTGQVIPGTAVTQTCIHEYEIYSRVQNIALFLARKLQSNGVHTPLGNVAKQDDDEL